MATESDEDIVLVEPNSDIIILDDDDINVAVATTSSTTTATTSTTKNKPSTDKTPMECPICLQNCIHPAKLPCGHIFCFLCVKGVAYKNRRCAMCRREIPTEFLDHPQLVHGVKDLCQTKATDDGYQWFYEGRNGWWQYDERTSQDIEESYKNHEKSCTILVAGYVYIVDFEAMFQQRQNDPSRRRHVKRDLATIPKKGVAGLRIDGTSSTSSLTTTAATSDNINLINLDNVTTLNVLDLLDHDDSDTDDTLTTAINSNNFISTIAATDAAIRIATDIIDSTLAHADELATTSNSSSNISNEIQSIRNNIASTSTATNNINRELLHETEEFLKATQEANIAATNLDTTTNHQHHCQLLISPNVDLFSQTLDDFRSLTLRNVIDSSDSDDDDDDGNEQIIL